MKYLSFKQFMLLQESARSKRHSITILNLLFHYNYYDDVCDEIELLFPIDDKNVLDIINCILRINITINESFPAHEDYALTILNKLFCSNNNRNEMVDFLNDNITELLTEHNIKMLYDKFHSRFGII